MTEASSAEANDALAPAEDVVVQQQNACKHPLLHTGNKDIVANLLAHAIGLYSAVADEIAYLNFAISRRAN